MKLTHRKTSIFLINCFFLKLKNKMAINNFLNKILSQAQIKK